MKKYIVIILISLSSCTNNEQIKVSGIMKNDSIEDKIELFNDSCLTIAGKGIDTTPEISNYKNLECLNLSNNSISYINCDYLLNTKIKSLNVSNNEIKELYLKIDGLKELDVSHNKLKRLYLFQSDSLKRLDCSFNNLVKVYIDNHSLSYINLLENPKLDGFAFFDNKIDSLLYDNYQKFLDSILVPID